MILSAFVAGCGGAESRWAGTISDSAGVTIVSNTDVGIWAPGEEWRLGEEVRIGAVEGPPEHQFGEVQEIAVDSRGRIFVLDGQAQHIQVYSPEPAWDLADDLRLLFGVSHDYRIERYSGGRLDRVVTKPFERRPVGDRHKEAIMSEMERRWTAAGLSAEVRARLENRFHVADFFPAFGTVAAGPLGTIWVQRVKSESELSEERPESFTDTGAPAWNYMDIGTPEWDVFDSEGRLLGVVRMPPRFSPMVFRGDKIYGVWRDELDVQYVLRLRILGDLGPGAT